MTGSFGSRLRGLWKRRYYLWSRISRPQVPVHPLSWLPSGFTLTPLGDTGVTMAEGFASAAELAQIEDPETERAFIYRAAMLSGKSDGFLEQSTVVEFGEQNAEVVLPGTDGYCVCVFATRNAELFIEVDAKRVAVAAEPGRAVGWPGHMQAVCRLAAGQSAVTVRLLQYGATRKHADASVDNPRQVRTGTALTGSETLPAGVWSPGADHLEAVFGKPDFLTKLIND